MKAYLLELEGKPNEQILSDKTLHIIRDKAYEAPTRKTYSQSIYPLKLIWL